MEARVMKEAGVMKEARVMKSAKPAVMKSAAVECWKPRVESTTAEPAVESATVEATTVESAAAGEIRPK